MCSPVFLFLIVLCFTPDFLNKLTLFFACAHVCIFFFLYLFVFSSSIHYFLNKLALCLACAHVCFFFFVPLSFTPEFLFSNSVLSKCSHLLLFQHFLIVFYFTPNFSFLPQEGSVFFFSPDSTFKHASSLVEGSQKRIRSIICCRRRSRRSVVSRQLSERVGGPRQEVVI